MSKWNAKNVSNITETEYGAEIAVFYVINAYKKDKIEKIEEKDQDQDPDPDLGVVIDIKIVRIDYIMI